MSFLKDIFSDITAEKVVRRAFSAWFISAFIATFSFVAENKNFLYSDKESIASVNFTLHVILTLAFFILIFAIFTFFKNDSVEKLTLLASYTVYAISCAAQQQDHPWVIFGLCAVLFAICVYAFDGKNVLDEVTFTKRGMIITAIICGVAFSAFVGIQCSFRVLAQSSPCFDFGIFSQMYYYMKETLQPLVTCERSELLSHFDVHVSPIYYLFLPMYALVPHPNTLVVCQAVMLASGVIPLVLLCRKLSLSYRSTALFTVCYVLYPTISGGCYYDLHENKFLMPIMLWLFYFIEKNKWWGILTFASLTLLVKEDAPVYVAFIALYLILSKKDYKKGITLFLLAVAYFAVVVAYLETYGYSGIMSNRYDNFIFEKDGGLLSVIKSVLISPANAIKEVLEADPDSVGSKFGFILTTLTPLCFLPFITKKFSRYILIGPYVLVNLMPDYLYQHSVYFQYTYGSVACLLYLSVLNYSELSHKFKRITGVFALIATTLFFCGTIVHKPNYVDNYFTSKEHHDYVNETLYSIPEEASVAASSMYVTTCSQRPEVYSLDDTNYKAHPVHTEYIVLDLRYKSNRDKFETQYKTDARYELIEYRERWLAVFRCKACAEGSCND